MTRYKRDKSAWDIAKRTVTKETLDQLFSYEELTGRLTWKVELSAKKPVGSDACRLDSLGYKRVSFGGREFMAHRVIGEMQTGLPPAHFIDHVDRDPGNNTCANLREATNCENQYNTKLNVVNSSGIKGATWRSKDRVWVAQIRHKGVRFYLGSFKTLTDCAEALFNKRQEFHGEFANNG